MRLRFLSLLLATLALLTVPHNLTAAALAPASRAFVEEFCTDCHDRATRKAGLNLEDLSLQIQDHRTAALWESVFDKIAQGAMPPKKAEQPSPHLRASFQKDLHAALHQFSTERQKLHGRVPIRRLTRAEYENTVRDLLHVETHLQDLFPEDSTTAGFHNVSQGLSFSAVHFARYQEAAEKAIADAIPTRPFTPLRTRIAGANILKDRDKDKNIARWGLRRQGEDFIMASNLFFPYTAVTLPRAPRSGRYRYEIEAYGLHTEGRPLPLAVAIRKDSSLPDAPEAAAWHDLPADTPATVSSELTLHAGENLALFGWTLPHRDTVQGKIAALKIEPEQWTGPALAVRSLFIEGPLDPEGKPESWPPQSYRSLFGEVPLRPLSQTQIPRGTEASSPPAPNDDPYTPDKLAKRNDAQWAADPLVPFSTSPREDAERLLKAFIPKAFRRPVPAELMRPYIESVHHTLDSGLPFHEAMRAAFKAVLCSPHFLILQETPGPLDAYAVASRLSYFLWNSPPDEPLLAKAADRSLHDASVRHAEVERLLAHPKAARFERSFTSQWLDLYKINASAPDAKLYPEFDRPLQDSALAETDLFFHEVLEKNLSVLEFIHSDWSFLNERLARHYDLPDLPGFNLRKVALPKEGPRGGILTQTSILKVTADGAKTSPILRGKWICERILGVDLPPPPEDVQKIEPDIRGAGTIRAQLEKHRSTPACASCHDIMDPPGFALETFDVIGGWRTFYRTPDPAAQKAPIPKTAFSVHRGLPVEEGYTTSDGTRFANTAEYKQLLLTQPDRITRNLAGKLLTYATGAPVQFADRVLVDDLVHGTTADHYGLRSLVHRVVDTPAFLHK
jgi:hypothetical protein